MEGDCNGLKEVMGYLMVVKDWQSVTDEITDLLKTTNSLIQAVIYKQLEVSVSIKY